MSSEFKLSDQTSVALPIKNIVAIVSAIVVAVWTYFGIVERLNRLETNEKLMAQDLLKKADQTPKNQELFMLIEYQAKDNRETYKTIRRKRSYKSINISIRKESR
jgi:hypothetical protein